MKKTGWEIWAAISLFILLMLYGGIKHPYAEEDADPFQYEEGGYR